MNMKQIYIEGNKDLLNILFLLIVLNITSYNYVIFKGKGNIIYNIIL